MCGQEGGQRVLTLSPCVPGEFTCDDGSCIPFSKRCDLKFDCGDKTDESFCDIVNIPDDYRSRLPPRPGEWVSGTHPLYAINGHTSFQLHVKLPQDTFRPRFASASRRTFVIKSVNYDTRVSGINTSISAEVWATFAMQHQNSAFDSVTTHFK